jgi:NAD(P)-dependent dehydrogenase (short-subunit alcohol dehydrogenase family)
MATYDFSGKTVVVTGGARGIGRRIAERFFEAGANVAICSRSTAGQDQVLAEIAGGELERLFAAAVDVADVEQLRSFLDAAAERFGRLDILVNNAGIMTSESIYDISEELWQRVIDTDLKSVVFASQHFAQLHRGSREPAAIVNISSISALTSLPHNLLYNVAKSGVNAVTRTMARALGPEGIRVNAVGPGSTPTDLNAALYADPAVEQALCERLPLGRRARKDDIADAVLFLAGDSASYITGQVLYVEGGWLTL